MRWGKYCLTLTYDKSTLKKSPKSLTLFTPNTSQFSKQHLEKLPQKNNVDGKEHVLGVRGLEFRVESWIFGIRNLGIRVEK